MEAFAHRSRITGKPFLGRLLWADTVQAIKLSADFSDFKAFRRTLEKSLRFNSSCVRAKRARDMVRWFFPSHSLDNLLTKVWIHYQSEQLLEEVMRHQFLTSQPLAAKFCLQCILPLEPGTRLNSDYFKDFLLRENGVVKHDVLNNLRWACKDIGFLMVEKNDLVVAQVPLPKTSLLLLTHYCFGQDTRTIAVKDIISNPYWRYLGIRNSEVVRKIFHEADAEGLVAKYVIADQLEQITTRYSFDEFIQRRLGL
jgi:hypothetical protein